MDGQSLQFTVPWELLVAFSKDPNFSVWCSSLTFWAESACLLAASSAAFFSDSKNALCASSAALASFSLA